jgi:hypothetical protein
MAQDPPKIKSLGENASTLTRPHMAPPEPQHALKKQVSLYVTGLNLLLRPLTILLVLHSISHRTDGR